VSVCVCLCVCVFVCVQAYTQEYGHTQLVKTSKVTLKPFTDMLPRDRFPPPPTPHANQDV